MTNEVKYSPLSSKSELNNYAATAFMKNKRKVCICLPTNKDYLPRLQRTTSQAREDTLAVNLAFFDTSLFWLNLL